MNRDRVIALGLLIAIVFWLIPGNDMTAFTCGGIVGLVIGATLGAAFVYNEWSPK
jgi:hypothetical protein